MRRDVCYQFNTDVQSLYDAYLKAAQNPPFGRSCKQEPYHTITFGLNFSMKYNMNGGSCILHFIPYAGGSAVDFRFVLAQGVGARCEKYADELTKLAAKELGAIPSRVNINVDYFMDEKNKVYAHTPVTPVAVAAPVQAAQPAPVAGSFCSQCGRAVKADDLFCSGCGFKLKQQRRFCPQCGNEAAAEDAFCCKCGSKL